MSIIALVGSLSWNSNDRSLKNAFEKYGRLLEAKVVLDKFSGRPRGFGFVSFDDKRAIEEAVEAINGMDLDGRPITVERAQSSQGGSGDQNGDYDRENDQPRGYGGGSRGSGGSGGGDCFKCGKPGHFARECPSDDGGRDGGRVADMVGKVTGKEVVVEVIMSQAEVGTSGLPREYDGACLQLRMSYAPAAHFLLFLVQ